MIVDDEDAYGHLVLDHLEGRDGVEIVERDDGWIATSGGPRSYFAPLRRWPAVERRALRHVRGRVLDVGCGAGRVALELERRGHEVLAIDISPLAVEVSRRRGVGEAAVMPFSAVSSRLGSFDTVVMMGNNFGLFANARRCRHMLRRLRGMTGETGRIVATSNDPYANDDEGHRAYQARNRARGRLSGQLRLRVRYRGYRTPWFEYLIVSADEMRDLAAGSGWRVARVIASPDSGLYTAVLEHDR